MLCSNRPTLKAGTDTIFVLHTSIIVDTIGKIWFEAKKGKFRDQC